MSQQSLSEAVVTDISPVCKTISACLEISESLIDLSENVCGEGSLECFVVVKDETAVAEVHRDAYAALDALLEVLDETYDYGCIVV